MTTPDTKKPNSKDDAIRVIALAAIVVSDEGDLILAGTPGTLLRWERSGSHDSVIVAWDAYMYAGSDQCCSRHCRTDGGYEFAVDASAIRYNGPGQWIDKPDEEVVATKDRA